MGIHQDVRESRDGKAPTGGAPNPIADATAAAKAKEKAADQPDDPDEADEPAADDDPEPYADTLDLD